MRTWEGLLACTALAAVALGGGSGWAAEPPASEPNVKDLLATVAQLQARLQQDEAKIAALQAAPPGRPPEKLDSVAAKVGAQGPAEAPSADLFHDSGLHPRSIKVGGNLDVTYQYNFNNPKKPATNVERVFDNADTNDFNVHLAELYFDGTAAKVEQAGFMLDLAFGSDAPLFAAANNLPNIKQAYVDYLIKPCGELRFKLGKFVTPMGLEVIPALDDWNSTRSFNFGKAIPFTHTGLELEYKATGTWTVAGYVVNGMDFAPDNNNAKSGMVTSACTPADWVSWNVELMAGNEQPRTESTATFLGNTNATFTAIPNHLAFAVDASYGLQQKATRSANGCLRDGRWWGAAGYVKYDINKSWYLAGRGECFDDSDAGIRSAALVKQRLYSGTFTVACRPVKPLEIRLEYRHDLSDKPVFIEHDGVTGTQHQDTLTLNWLYRF